MMAPVPGLLQGLELRIRLALAPVLLCAGARVSARKWQDQGSGLGFRAMVHG